MKRTRRPLPIPQRDFGFTRDTFNLFTESTRDGDRIASDRAQAERARQLAEAAQTALFTSNHNQQKT